MSDSVNLKNISELKFKNVKKDKKYVTPLAILACFLWSTAFVGVKIGFRYMHAPLTFAGMRFFLAGIILIPFLWGKKSYKEFIQNWKVIAYVAFLNTFLGYAFYYSALTYVSGATAAIVIGSGPLTIALMSHFLMQDDKMNRLKFFSIFLGLVGVSVVIINSKPLTSLGKKEFLGMFLLVLKSILGGLANIKVAKTNSRMGSGFLASNQMIFGGALLLVMGRATEGEFDFSHPIQFYISLLWLAMVSAVTFSIWFYILKFKNVKVSEINMWKFIIPVSGAFLSWMILPNESPDFISILGMFLVFVSLIVYSKYSE